MPLTFPDRFWWLQRAWGVLGVLASLGGIVELVVHVAGIHNLFNLGTGWQFFIILLVIVVLSLIAAALGTLPILGVLLVSLAYLRRASPARDRFHRRLLAIEGDENAIPLAEIEVDAAEAPKLSSDSLKLMWQPTILARLTLALIELIFVPVFAFLAGLGVYLAYGILTTNQAQLSLLARGGLLLLVAGALVGVPLLVVVLLVFALPMVVIRSFGILADADGILYRSTRTGRRRVLQWDEIRLFEVEQIEKQKPGKCRLYGQSAFI